MVAPVTAQPLTLPATAMNGQRNIAVRAHHHLSTTATTQKSAVTAAWDQHHRLFASAWQRCQPIHESATDQAFVALCQFEAHIDDPNRRQWLFRDPCLKPCENKRSLGLKPVPAFQGWCGAAEQKPAAMTSHPL